MVTTTAKRAAACAIEEAEIPLASISAAARGRVTSQNAARKPLLTSLPPPRCQ